MGSSFVVMEEALKKYLLPTYFQGKWNKLQIKNTIKSCPYKARVWFRAVWLSMHWIRPKFQLVCVFPKEMPVRKMPPKANRLCFFYLYNLTEGGLKINAHNRIIQYSQGFKQVAVCLREGRSGD